MKPSPARSTDAAWASPAGRHLSERRALCPVFRARSGAKPVARTGFFTSSPIDERCAAYGKYFEDVSFRQYVPDKTACCRLDGAAVIGSDGLIWDNGLLLRDSVRHLSYSIANSVCARIHEDDSVTLKRPLMLGSATAGSFFCGFTGSWRGYSHWLIESMPRLYIYTQLRKEIPSLKILLPEFPKGGFQEQALQLFSIASHDVITVANHAIFRAQHLYVAGAIDIWSVPRIVLAAAQCLLSVVRGAVSHLEFPEDRRIYIHRAPPARRAVRNLNQLQPILDEYRLPDRRFRKFFTAASDFAGGPIPTCHRRSRRWIDQHHVLLPWDAHSGALQSGMRAACVLVTGLLLRPRFRFRCRQSFPHGQVPCAQLVCRLRRLAG